MTPPDNEHGFHPTGEVMTTQGFLRHRGVVFPCPEEEDISALANRVYGLSALARNHYYRVAEELEVNLDDLLNGARVYPRIPYWSNLGWFALNAVSFNLYATNKNYRTPQIVTGLGAAGFPNALVVAGATTLKDGERLVEARSDGRVEPPPSLFEETIRDASILVVALTTGREIQGAGEIINELIAQTILPTRWDKVMKTIHRRQIPDPLLFGGKMATDNPAATAAVLLVATSGLAAVLAWNNGRRRSGARISREPKAKF